MIGESFSLDSSTKWCPAMISESLIPVLSGVHQWFMSLCSLHCLWMTFLAGFLSALRYSEMMQKYGFFQRSEYDNCACNHDNRNIVLGWATYLKDQWRYYVCTKYYVQNINLINPYLSLFQVFNTNDDHFVEPFFNNIEISIITQTTTDAHSVLQ